MADAVANEDGTLSLRRIPGLKVPRTAGGRNVLAGYDLLLPLVEGARATANWHEAIDGVALEVGPCAYFADCWEELYILHEIFVVGDYDLLPCLPTVLLDVGANVGFSSIFLAGSVPDLLVEAFEPVAVNYRKAMRNIAANPTVAPRVCLHNVGLYSHDSTVSMTSESARRGRSSIAIDRRKHAIGPVEEVKATVRCASDVVREVKAKYPDRSIAIKMDCEGSEYPVVRQLYESGALRLAGVYLMEWHRGTSDGEGPDLLRDLFSRAGYSFYVRGRMDVKAEAGMAFAVRCTC